MVAALTIRKHGSMNVAHDRVYVMIQEILERKGPEAHRLVFARQKGGVSLKQFLLRKYDGKKLDDVVLALVDRYFLSVAPDDFEGRRMSESGFVRIDPGFAKQISADRFNPGLACKPSTANSPVAQHWADAAFR